MTSRIDIWQIRFDQVSVETEKLAGLLSSQERQQCGRFAFLELKHKFIVRRSLLRIVLGEHLNVVPDKIELHFFKDKKPQLTGFFADHDIHFNTSHSQNLGLIAISDQRLGIDVERTSKIKNIAAITNQIYSSGEQSAFNLLSPDKRLDALFRSWTIKEAIVKATGEGLSGDVSKIATDIGSRQSPVRRHGICWHIHPLDVPDGYYGTLASVDPAPEIHFHDGQTLLTNPGREK